MSDGKVVLVTAGGSGMGAACARHLAETGWRVGILSSSGKGEALADELGGVGVTGSNQNEADLQRAVDAVMARWGRIDGLVNSAGHGPRAPILQISDADWHRGLEVYFLNVVRAARLVTPILEAQGGGAIGRFDGLHRPRAEGVGEGLAQGEVADGEQHPAALELLGWHGGADRLGGLAGEGQLDPEG